MQSACDKEFNALLSEMRTCLRENGRDQSLADNAQKAYESAKASMVKELKNVVYNTAVGNGAVAHGYSPIAIWPECSKMIRQKPWQHAAGLFCCLIYLG